MDLMESYAMIRIDLQAFSMESPENDVVGDGYKSDINRLRVRFDIRNYNLPMVDFATAINISDRAKEPSYIRLNADAQYGCTAW